MDLDIEKIVERQVKAEVESLDIQDMVAGFVQGFIAQSAGKEIIAIVREEAKKLVGSEVAKCLAGPVSTNDGWGEKKHYDSFEDLFRSTLRSALNSKHDVHREIKKLVEARVSALIKNDYNKILEKMVDDLTSSKLVK